jgi:hypothetical protein
MLYPFVTVMQIKSEGDYDDDLTVMLLDCFTFTPFDWSRTWGFTSSSSAVDFISSVFVL